MATDGDAAGERMRIDHVPYGVRDLDKAVERFKADYGLDVLMRQSHPELGTHNALLPVGYGQYIELLAIADPASHSALAIGLRRLLEHGDRVAGIALRDPNIDVTARRLSLRVVSGEGRSTDGRVRTWRRTLPEATPQFPFFIDYQGTATEMDAKCGAAATTDGVAWVEVGGDATQVAEWIGDDQVPIRVVSGGFPGPRRFALRTLEGAELVIE